MSPTDAPVILETPAAPPLSWPPPGLEPIHGRLWRIIGTLATGGIIMVAPLLWALAVEHPFWSLGPMEGNWQIGTGLALFGLAVLLLGFAALVRLLRAAAHAADVGYGAATIWETAADSNRDTGFLIQGRRHFSHFDAAGRAALVRDRLRAAFLMLAAALWLPASFAVGVLLAARGWVSAPGIWLLTLGPAAVLAVIGGVIEISQSVRVSAAQNAWLAESGGEQRVLDEVRGWQARLSAAGDQVAMGSGTPARARQLRLGAVAMVALFLLVLVPTATIALTSGVGPALASTAVPTFLSVQETAGAAEVLRVYRLESDPALSPLAAGEALQNLVFVGPAQRPEPMERAPRARYEQPWFVDAETFPDPFSETAARDLIARTFSSFTPEERASLQQAAAHPAHAELAQLGRAPLADVVSGRWSLPFPDGSSLFDLPWPRFAGIRTAGLAHVARAAVEMSQGRTADAEQTARELISAGFLLIDEGPTLIDNMMGVSWVNMGGDALEELYRKTGREAEADRLKSARESAALSASMARVGNGEQDIHTLLRGIPALVERDDAMRGLRWEYLATFNMLAPCINLQKMVFGPDKTYVDWMDRAQKGLVRVPGEGALFELARSGASGVGDGPTTGALPRLLSLTLGTQTQPGSCARLVSALRVADGM